MHGERDRIGRPAIKGLDLILHRNGQRTVIGTAFERDDCSQHFPAIGIQDRMHQIVREGAREFLAVQRTLNRQRDCQIDENRDGLALGQQEHHGAVIGAANLYIGDRDLFRVCR